MDFKKGVNPSGIRPELLIALWIADGVYKELGQSLVITSLNDSQHSYGSLHFSGSAADLRTRFFDDNGAKARDMIAARLGNSPDFDVVLESNHIHIEWQPKK